MKHILPLCLASLLGPLVMPLRLSAQQEGSWTPVHPVGEETAAEEEASGIPTEEEIVEEVEAKEPEAEAGFDYSKAVFDSTDIFYSSEVKRTVRECLMKWSFSIPEEFSMIVNISPQGKVTSVDIKEDIAENAAVCIAKELASLPFVPAPKSYVVAVRYTFQSLGAAPQAAPGKKTAKMPRPPDTFEDTDPDSSRLIYLQTAYPRGKKVCNLTFIDGPNLKMGCGVKDNIDISFNTIVPLWGWGLGVFPKFSFRAHEHVQMAVKLDFGFFWPFIVEPSAFGIMYGGAPLMVTAGNRNNFFHFSVHLEGVSVLWGGLFLEDWENGGLYWSNFFIIFPSMGASIRIAKRVKFNLEGWTLLSPSKDLGELNGKLWGVMYGFRIFGGRLYGDINFVIPVYEGWWHIQKFIPIGFPMFAFGFNV